jgi:hypothetical protein
MANRKDMRREDLSKAVTDYADVNMIANYFYSRAVQGAGAEGAK